MKRSTNSCFVAGLVLCAPLLLWGRTALQRAHDDGARLRVTVRAADARGGPVTNASVRAIFHTWEDKAPQVVSVTDTNGMCTVEGLCALDMTCSIFKEGYYSSGFSCTINEFKDKSVITIARSMPDGKDGAKHTKDELPLTVKDGKWQPWNPTIEIMLKEKRNPIPMYVRQVTIKLPKSGEAFGFDFMAGDLVKPHGKGEQADLLFMCAFEKKSEAPGDYKAELLIAAVRQDEGVRVNTKDTWSGLKSAYEAQENGYEPQYYSVTDRTPSKILRQVELAAAEYLTFRTRIVRDDEGKIISSHYGKIMADGTIDYGIDFNNPDGTRVSFTYYFNPTPNDRNIEFDTGKNLFGNDSRDRGFAP